LKNPRQSGWSTTDELNRHFLVRNVTSDFVARDKEEFYRRGRRIIDYHIDNVSEKYRELE
jgi:hypothetical protein